MVDVVLSAIPNFFTAPCNAWDVVTLPKSQVSMGLRKLKSHNDLLMAVLIAKLLSGGGSELFLTRHIIISVTVILAKSP
jgi:hypothetical protein